MVRAWVRVRVGALNTSSGKSTGTKSPSSSAISVTRNRTNSSRRGSSVYRVCVYCMMHSLAFRRGSQYQRHLGLKVLKIFIFLAHGNCLHLRSIETARALPLSRVLFHPFRSVLQLDMWSEPRRICVESTSGQCPNGNESTSKRDDALHGLSPSIRLSDIQISRHLYRLTR